MDSEHCEDKHKQNSLHTGGAPGLGVFTCVKRSKDTKGYISYNSIYMKFSDQKNPQKQEGDLWLQGAGGNGEWGETAERYQVFSGGKEGVLELNSGNGCTRCTTW